MFERSLDTRRSLKDEAGVAENLRDLAQLDVELGNAEAGVRGYRAALAHLQAHGYARHPLVIEIQRSLALLYRNRGETDAALASFQRARDLSEEIHGPCGGTSRPCTSTRAGCARRTRSCDCCMR